MRQKFSILQLDTKIDKGKLNRYTGHLSAVKKSAIITPNRAEATEAGNAN